MITALVLGGCSKVEEPPLVISSDVWIGAAPLYYAHAMGWLKEANIEMLQANSIEENLNLYETHASDIVTGTEHEYLRLRQKHTDLIPVIIYDRSYGGDVIMANRSVDALIVSKEKIDVFVELNTVGEDMLNYFLSEYNLSKDRFTIYSRSQSEIESAQNTPNGKALIAVTYNPHDLVLREHGFQEIASSKNDKYIVVDAVLARRDTVKQHQGQLKELKRLMEKGVEAYHQNPKAFYATVKSYFGHPSYEEFEKMRANVQWVSNDQLTPMMKQKLQEFRYPTAELIQ